MDFSMVSTVVAITVICYLIGMVVKAFPVDNKWIPIVVGVTGAVLGVVGMYVIADFPAQNVLDALSVGIMSGLASTGINQVIKQQTK